MHTKLRHQVFDIQLTSYLTFPDLGYDDAELYTIHLGSQNKIDLITGSPPLLAPYVLMIDIKVIDTCCEGRICINLLAPEF
jgi:hypothetical protein